MPRSPRPSPAARSADCGGPATSTARGRAARGRPARATRVRASPGPGNRRAAGGAGRTGGRAPLTGVEAPLLQLDEPRRLQEGVEEAHVYAAAAQRARPMSRRDWRRRGALTWPRRAGQWRGAPRHVAARRPNARDRCAPRCTAAARLFTAGPFTRPAPRAPAPRAPRPAPRPPPAPRPTFTLLRCESKLRRAVCG
ncbi:unnamed protein product [Colias eurytheme]|nr:unnamed protein product [Colias eurytheme]